MGGGKKDMETGRKSVTGSYDPSGRKSRIPAAYPVTMLVDLQVYVVPREKWVLSRRLYRHNIVEEGISLGFVRVLPQLSIHNLRRELQLQLGPDVIPRDFIFIRAVGNIFIQLKPKQEIELKVKNFIPPFSQEPEIYLLEVLPNEDPRMVSPLPLLLREDTPPHICHDLCHHSLARKTVQVIKRDSESPQPTTPFPPVSITPSINHYPLSPYSPSEYDLLKQYQTEGPGEITQSRVDLAERQAAYDYENEIFESPTPSPTIPKSATPSKTLHRQKPVSPTASFENEEHDQNSTTHSQSFDNEELSRNSTSHSHDQTTTESPSSAETVRTAIRMDANTTSRSDEDVTDKNRSNLLESHVEGSSETENKTESEIKTENTKSHENANTTSETQSNIVTHKVTVTATATTLDETLTTETSKEESHSEEKSKQTENNFTDIQIEKKNEDIKHSTEENESSQDDTTITACKSEEIEPTMEIKNTVDEQLGKLKNIKVQEKLITLEAKDATLQQNIQMWNDEKATFTQEKVSESIIDDTQFKKDDENKLEETKLESKIENKPLKKSGSSKSNNMNDVSTSNTSTVTVIPIQILNGGENLSTEKSTSIKTLQKAETETQDVNDGEFDKPFKPKPFRDPRKPALYPQRMTKTTIVRQALAREKRRVYVEERIQSYMKNSQQVTSSSSQQASKSTTRSNTTTEGFVEGTTTRHVTNDSEKVQTISQHGTFNMRTDSHKNNMSKMEPLQSLPDIHSFHNNSPRRFPYESDLPPKTLSAISVIKPPPYSYSSSFAMANSNVTRSHSDMASRATFDSDGSRNSGIYVDSNPESTSNFWKNVSEQGFFYSFRVRQSGTVQMIDKSSQTGEQPQSYVLDFSRKPNGSYFLKSCNPLPQSTTNDMHLPPINRDKILRDISETVQLRHDAELRRAELIQRANDLQTMVKEKRDKINRRHEFWHKKYIEESSVTRPMEAGCNSLRAELNTVHRRLIAHLEGRDLPLRLRDGPSKKANYKIMAARLQHEIKELQQKAKSAKLRLESEIKLKEQAEREVRDIRNDLAHKKVVMSLARSQIGTIPATHPRGYDKYDSLVY